MAIDSDLDVWIDCVHFDPIGMIQLLWVIIFLARRGSDPWPIECCRVLDVVIKDLAPIPPVDGLLLIAIVVDARVV